MSQLRAFDLALAPDKRSGSFVVCGERAVRETGGIEIGGEFLFGSGNDIVQGSAALSQHEIEAGKFAQDFPLEGTGFEPAVPLPERGRIAIGID